MLSVFEGFPPPAEESSTVAENRAAYLASDIPGTHYLAYEKARDFLSTPRAFVILRIEMQKDDGLEIRSSADPFAPSEFNASAKTTPSDGQNLPELESTGWFTIDSPGSPRCFLFKSKKQAIMFSCHEIQLEQTLYHCETAQAALVQYFQTHIA